MGEKVAFVDVDNTLWDFDAELRRRLVEVLGEDAVPKEFAFWEQPEVLLGSKDAACEIFNDMHSTQHHYEAFDNAEHVLRSLKRMGYKILIATNRLPEYRDSLVCWLDDYEMPYDEIWCALDKDQLLEQRKDIELVFDDAPYIIDAATQRDIQTIALRYSYNKNMSDPNLKKFKTCFEIHDYLTRLSLYS